MVKCSNCRRETYLEKAMCFVCSIKNSVEDRNVDRCCDEWVPHLDAVKTTFYALFEKQKEFQKEMNLSVHGNVEYMNMMFLALFSECAEALHETAWKNPTYVKYGWKHNQGCNYLKLEEEFADMLIFIMNICSAAGIQSQSLLNRVYDKIEINKKRQKEKY